MYRQSGFCTSFNLGASLRNSAAANWGPWKPTKQAANQSAVRDSTAGANDSAPTRRSLPSLRTRVKSVGKQIITFELVRKSLCCDGRQLPETKDAVMKRRCCNVPQHHKSHVFGKARKPSGWDFFCQRKQKLEEKFLGFYLLINIHVLVLFCFFFAVKCCGGLCEKSSRSSGKTPPCVIFHPSN